MNFTIIIPAYNEEKSIGVVIKGLIDLYKNSVEIIVVNDGSTDNTMNIVKQYPSVRLINQKRNFGYGAALKSGIIESKTPWICMFDADGQHNPNDVARLWQIASNKNIDMIVGSRGLNAYSNLLRAPGKIIISIFANILLGKRVPDLNSGLRMIRKEIILRYLHILPNGFSASTTTTMIMLSRDYDVRYIDINMNSRIGKSQVKQLRDGFRTMMQIIQMTILFNPRRFFIPISVFLFITGILYGSVKLYQIGTGLSVGTLLILSTSITIFFFGLLCEQISSMRLERFEEKDAIRRYEKWN